MNPARAITSPVPESQRDVLPRAALLVLQYLQTLKHDETYAGTRQFLIELRFPEPILQKQIPAREQTTRITSIVSRQTAVYSVASNGEKGRVSGEVLSPPYWRP